MLKSFQSIALILVAFAFVSGCSTNKAADDAISGADDSENSVSEASTSMGTGIDDTGVDIEEPTDPLEGVSSTFYFEFDSAVLNAEARAALIAHAEVLRDTLQSVRLEGHADERGSREYNMALGERRANAVRDFLIVQGVGSSQLETISYGEERPAEMGGSDYAWSQNRRVEIAY